jgi:site-specific DNA-methyltransferase (cytosine-N4-specific)
LITEELIAIIIGHGSIKINVFELSNQLADFLRSKINQGIKIEELLRFDGIGEVKAMQLLSALELGRRYYSTSSRKLSDYNWDFINLKQSERQYGVHFFHHYTAKFIPQIPSRLIERLGKINGVVVDPFMGSGTTLVEAKLFGCNSYGLDTNPLAIKISKAKTMVLDEKKIEEIDRILKWIKQKKKDTNNDNAKLTEPSLFQNSELWFRYDVAIKIKSILEEITNYSQDVQNFFQIGLSSLLKGMSNARMDSVTPVLPDCPVYIDRKHYYREVNNLKRNIPVFERLYSQIYRMKYALIKFNNDTNSNLICKPILGDARELSKYINHCDLVVTSPPYWSAQNYAKIHMLSIKIFGLSTEEGTEIGRDSSSYLIDMEKVFHQIAKVLSGYFALVIGEDENKSYHENLYLIAQGIGFNHIDTITRRISNQVSRAKLIKNEYIYIFQK